MLRGVAATRSYAVTAWNNTAGPVLARAGRYPGAELRAGLAELRTAVRALVRSDP